MTIEQVLEQLAQKRQFLILIKANKGYSVVIGDFDDYSVFLMRHHYNGESVESALEELLRVEWKG